MSEPIKKVVFIVSLCLVAVIFFLLTNEPDTESMESNNVYENMDNNLTKTSLDNEEEIKEEIAMIDVKGEVNTPGVYKVRPDARVNDVIQLAGGFTDEADESQINLAQKVHDEMIIIVLKPGDENTLGGGVTGSDSTGKVRINYASQEEIETLNGVGPSKAQAIIQYREENGLFQLPEDLMQISGIGEKTLANFEDQIQIP